MRAAILLLSTSVVFYGSPAFADIGESDLEARIAALELEQSEVNTRAPKTAAIIGGVLAGVGGITAGATAIACNSNGIYCRHQRARSIEIGAGIVAGIGLVMLVSGLVTAAKRDQRKDELGREILDLKNSRAEATSNFKTNVGVGETTMLTLSWEF